LTAELRIPATGSMKLLGWLLFLLLLLRLEGRRSVGNAAFHNNMVAPDHALPRSLGVLGGGGFWIWEGERPI
jgi:hypothetical protein